MRGNAHVRFGGRSGETGWPECQYRASLRPYESHFTALKKFAVAGTDDPPHEYRRWRIARYLTWRNHSKGSSKAALAKFSRTKLM